MKLSKSVTLLSALAVGLISWQQAQATGRSNNFSITEGFLGDNAPRSGQQGWITSVMFGGLSAFGDYYYAGRLGPTLPKNSRSSINIAGSSHNVALFSTGSVVIGSLSPDYRTEGAYGFHLRNSVGIRLTKFQFKSASAHRSLVTLAASPSRSSSAATTNFPDVAVTKNLSNSTETAPSVRAASNNFAVASEPTPTPSRVPRPDIFLAPPPAPVSKPVVSEP